MAKKKAKPNYTGWIVAAIIVLVIILLVVKIKPTEEKVTTAPKEVTKEPGRVTKSVTAPEMVAKCDLNYVIGQVGRCTLSGEDAKMPVINSGKGKISGMWFKVIAIDGKETYFKSSEPLNVKETKEYTLELSSWSKEIGSEIESVILYPMTSDGKACENQKIGQQINKCI